MSLISSGGIFVRTVLSGIAVLLLASTAQAADLKAADLEVIDAPNVDVRRFAQWEGAYAGVSAGYGWLRDVMKIPGNFVYDQGADWVVGAHAGYLLQFGNVVVGAEVEATRLDITYELASNITVENAYAAKLRAGYAVDRALLSAHAGGVYATTDFMGLKDWGWTAGFGADYALTDRVTIGAQYSHYKFKEFDGSVIDADVNLVTGRIGIRF